MLKIIISIYNASETEVKETKTILIWSILLWASICDARYYKIPNQLIVVGYLIGIIMNLIEYQALGIVYFIIRAGWPILILTLLRICGKTIGMGDVKIISVMSTMLCVDDLIFVMAASVMLAGVAIILRCIIERQFVKKELHYSFYITAAFFLLPFQTQIMEVYL